MKEKIEIKDLLQYEIVSNIQAVGDKLIVSKQTMDEKKNGYINDLYLVNNDLTLRPLTSSHHVSDFIKENDTTILFIDSREKEDEPKKDEKKTVFYRLSLEGGEAIKAFEVPYNVMEVKKYQNTLILLVEEKLNETKEEDYVILTEVPFVANGAGFIDSSRMGLIQYNLETKEEIRITEKGFDVETFIIEKDMIYYTGKKWQDVREIKSGLYSYQLEHKVVKQLIDDYSYRIDNLIVRKNELILLMNNMKEYDTDQYNDFYSYNLDTNEIKQLLHYEYPTYPSVSSDVASNPGKSLQIYNDELYFISTYGYIAEIYRLMEGEIEKQFSFNGVITSYYKKDEDYYFIGMQEGQLPEIYHYSHQECVGMSCFSKILENKSVQKVNHIPFINRKGMQIDAWIIEPVGLEEGKKYPAILDIHGGPRGDYGDVFFHEMQVWANEGYYVFFCNPQGSDGYGQEFGDMRMMYGTKDYDDLMDLTDYVIDNYPQIDIEKLGVTGGSYGGIMTNWIITHTDRFKAAATQRSVCNWISDFGTSGISYSDGLFKHAKPWDRMEDMWNASALKYANQCHTPTLFIHSFEDYICAISQAYELFTALKVLGVETKAVLFKGENHGLSRRGKPTHRFKRLEEITNWMNSHLK